MSSQNKGTHVMYVPLLCGDPYRIRTDVKGVRGLCLNHLTNGPHFFFYFIGQSR